VSAVRQQCDIDSPHILLLSENWVLYGVISILITMVFIIFEVYDRFFNSPDKPEGAAPHNLPNNG
jgi:hypothetical protein